MRRIAEALFQRLRLRVVCARQPDVVIGGGDRGSYLHRWHLIRRNPLFNIYLHNFRRSDDDRALHDHPWANVSFLLRGSYTEHTIAAGGIHHRTVRHAGDLKARLPGAAHRIELTHGDCWTLFITGPKVRHWGFHHPTCGWVHWLDFTAQDGNGASVYVEGACADA